MTDKFWKTKKLEEFTSDEWENICCNCGKCCLIKLQDEDDDEVYYTNITCKYFDPDSCKCNEYENRRTLVPECLKLDIKNINEIDWMPQSCAYKILINTGDLPSWHPLLTKHPLDDIHSIKGKCICQTKVKEEDWEDHIIEDEEI